MGVGADNERLRGSQCPLAEGAGLVDLGGQFLNPRHHRRCSASGGSGISNAIKNCSLKRFRVSGVLPEQSASTVVITLGSRNQYFRNSTSTLPGTGTKVGNSPET